MTATAKRGATTPRKAARPRKPAADGNGTTSYEPPTTVPPPTEFTPVEHPLYGTRKLYTYQPRDGSKPIVLPHISTCRPTVLWFYKNRKLDEMRQAFAWMDLCGVPDEVGERVFSLPQGEQATVLSEWFSGLRLTPEQGVTPPGES